MAATPIGVKPETAEKSGDVQLMCGGNGQVARLRRSSARADLDGIIAQLLDAALPDDEARRARRRWARHRLNLAALDALQAGRQLERQGLAWHGLLDERLDREELA